MCYIYRTYYIVSGQSYVSTVNTMHVREKKRYVKVCSIIEMRLIDAINRVLTCNHA